MPEEDFNGRGKFIFANGDVYEGQYELNKATGTIERQGYGVLTSKDGTLYSGVWKNDKLNGSGSFTHTSTGCKYEGDFLNGKFDGIGKYFWPDGSIYEGEFKESKLEGKGFFKDPTGQIWSGKFSGDSAARLRFKLSM